MKKGVVVLAAGGTGGHLFPALALTQALQQQGYDVHILTDRRAEKYIHILPKTHIHLIKSATLKGKSPVALGKFAWNNFSGFFEAVKILKKLKPVLIGGFGGYPTVPPLLAASFLKIPSFIHEQNAVMGRANRLLAYKAKFIAGGFLKEVPPQWQKKLVIVGNPLRPAVIKVLDQPYPKRNPEDSFRLVIFGGSQGASFFDKIFPKTFALLSEKERAKIFLIQQSRGDKTSLEAAYQALGMKVEIAPFFEDLPQKIADAHFVIARSGASTVSEISAIGRPSLLIPYPHALDHDQAANAEQLVKAKGAVFMREESLSEDILAHLIKDAMLTPELLAQQAANAKRFGKSDAINLLLDLVQKLQKTVTLA